MSDIQLAAARINFVNHFLVKISQSEDQEVISSIDELLRTDEVREEIIDGLRRLDYDVTPIRPSA